MALRTGEPDDYCEPRAAHMEAWAVRRNVITSDGRPAGVTPGRAVAGRIGEAAAAVARPPPTADSLKRPAQNAASRARQKARLEGVSEFVGL